MSLARERGGQRVELRLERLHVGEGHPVPGEQFHSALKFVATGQQIDVTGTEVSASVSIGTLENGGFGLAVELDVHAPSLPHDEALALVEQAHQVCPYSNATRGNVEVKLSVI